MGTCRRNASSATGTRTWSIRPATGTRAWSIRPVKPKPVRYEKQTPGELVHVDIKKLGRIPDGGGWRMLGRQAGNRNNKKRGLGYAWER